MAKLRYCAATSLAVAALLASNLGVAGAIFSPQSVTATNSNDIDFGVEQNLINHAGLGRPDNPNNFISGVTDLAAYLATNPQHGVGTTGEWFTDLGPAVPTARITFDLGATKAFDRLVVWNDEADGVGTITAAVSGDGVNYTGIGTFKPTDWNFIVSSYGPDVFAFQAVSARYLRFDLSDCFQPLHPFGALPACGLGEVAMGLAAPVPDVPAPQAWVAGLAGLYAWRRFRAKPRAALRAPVLGFSALVSSRSSTAGSTATRCCWPPDHARAWRRTSRPGVLKHLEPVDATQQRALAAAALADDRNDFAARHVPHSPASACTAH